MIAATRAGKFFQKAHEIWGDKYDYSESVFHNLRAPITIVCRTCGPFTLSQAGSHIRNTKRKPCGCRACEQREALERKGQVRLCRGCGKWNKHRGTGDGTRTKYCRDCYAWATWAKETLAKSMKRTRRNEKEKSTPWLRWAVTRYTSLTVRDRKKPIERKANVPATWKDWSRRAIRIKERAIAEQSRTGWDRKARYWYRALKKRSTPCQ